MSNEIPLIEGSTGLNTVVPSHRTKEPELVKATNVRIGPDGEIILPTGYAKLQDLVEGHSLWCNGGPCLVAQGTVLYNVASDYSLRAIATGLSGDPISYWQHGNITYYVDGSIKGMVKDYVAGPWLTDTYNGPTTEIHWEAKVPKFSHIFTHSGRMYGLYKNMLLWSEPNRFGLFSFKHIKTFGSNLIMGMSVKGGIFLSDEKGIHFLAGRNPHEAALEQVATYPAYEWGECVERVEGLEIGLPNPGQCVLFATTKGLVLGTPEGQLLNLTRKKIIYPTNGTAAATLLRGYEVIQTIR